MWSICCHISDTSDTFNTFILLISSYGWISQKIFWFSCNSRFDQTFGDYNKIVHGVNLFSNLFFSTAWRNIDGHTCKNPLLRSGCPKRNNFLRNIEMFFDNYTFSIMLWFFNNLACEKITNSSLNIIICLERCV